MKNNTWIKLDTPPKDNRDTLLWKGKFARHDSMLRAFYDKRGLWMAWYDNDGIIIPEYQLKSYTHWLYITPPYDFDTKNSYFNFPISNIWLIFLISMYAVWAIVLCFIQPFMLIMYIPIMGYISYRTIKDAWIKTKK